MRIAGAGVFQIEGKASAKALRQRDTPFVGSTMRKSMWRSRGREEGNEGDADIRGKLEMEVDL